MNERRLDLISDEILMTKVRNDDLDSLVPLFERYKVRLFNFFLRLSHDRAGSEDLVQNLFMRIIRYRHTFRSGYKFRTWVYQMARNLFYDESRRQGRHDQTFARMTVLHESVAATSGGDDGGQLNEARLNRALGQLQDDKKDILIMSKIHRLPYEEIAIITETTVGNVKVRVHRAVEALRTLYYETSES